MSNWKIEVKKIEYFLIVVFLFLAAMNFQAKFFYFVFAAFLVLILLERKLKVNMNLIPYVLLGLVMSLYNADEGVLSMLRCFAYALCYIIGSNLIINNSEERLNSADNIECMHKTGQTVLSAVCWGSFVHFMLNFIINQGFLLGRNTNDIWTGVRLSATIQAAMACLMTGLAVSMVICPRKKFSRFIGVIALVCIMAYNLILAGRTLLFMMLFVFILGLIYFLTTTKNQTQKNNTLILVAIAIVAIILAFAFNVGGIQDYVFESNLFSRLDKIDDDMIGGERTRRKILFLQNMWRHPFGGLHMRGRFGYAHDLLLDAYDEYGFFEVVILLFILVTGVVELVKLCRNKDFSISFRLSYLCVYTLILLEFCIEPIFEGIPWIFVCYCLLNGCINSINNMHRRTLDIRGETLESITD